MFAIASRLYDAFHLRQPETTIGTSIAGNKGKAGILYGNGGSRCLYYQPGHLEWPEPYLSPEHATCLSDRAEGFEKMYHTTGASRMRKQVGSVSRSSLSS